MTKILVTGANGFLGSNMARVLSSPKQNSLVLTSRAPALRGPRGNLPYFQGDLLDYNFVHALFHSVKPDVVINTVGLVNVDQCEEMPDLAYNLNIQTAKNIAAAAKADDVRLVYISTDQLYDGKKLVYSEDDVPSPLNAYGRTKLESEQISMETVPDAIVVRTNFFGWSPAGHLPTFGEWVYQSLVDKKPMTLFTNFFFSPMEVTYLCEAVESLMNSSFAGVINVVGSTRCSKYDFGIALADEFGLDPSPIHATEMNQDFFKARRPNNMSLSGKKFEKYFNTNLPTLQESLYKFRLTQNHTW